MAVTRCVCHQRTFAELDALSARRGWSTLRELAQHTQAGTGCGSCRPYLTAMLATGCTRFEVASGGRPPQPAPPEASDPQPS